MTYPINWNLDTIFPGGITSPAMTARLAAVSAKLVPLQAAATAWQPAADSDAAVLLGLLNDLEEVTNGLSTVGTFANMIHSADTSNAQAGVISNQVAELATQLVAINNTLTAHLVAMSDADFARLVALPPLAEVAFSLTERRTQGKELLPAATEALIEQLAIDGFHGWSDHYDNLSAALTFNVTLAGKPLALSAGQAQNRFEADPSAANRAAVFAAWEATWAKHSQPFADTLNHLTGFRLANNAAHHQTDDLHIPLQLNRMQAQTVDQMWATVSANKAPFVAYLDRKAQLLGQSKMAWQDQWAPVALGGFTPKHYTFDEAADFIIENFRRFSPKMAAFAQHAFANGWIEAEDRPGKIAGGYMTEVPDVKESRIFMTFDGSASGVSTIAHELGHAFHASILKDYPLPRREYAMNVAETASTFAELIIADATVNQATSPEERLNLLDAKMANPLAMLLNIHARYLFERRFYAARHQGTVTVAQLNALMQGAQEEAYAGGLASYDPLYWANKLHFFIDDVPFYNFPYTFGYLFSSGIYAKAQAQGGNFEDHYIALLKDTANMSTEALAQKHLGVDLQQPAFWQQGIDLAAQDAQRFLTLSEAYLPR